MRMRRAMNLTSVMLSEILGFDAVQAIKTIKARK